MSWFEDDPELLRAALDILDTWNGGTTASDISVASPSTDGAESIHSANDDGDDGMGPTLDLDDWLKPTRSMLVSSMDKAIKSSQTKPVVTPIKTRTQDGARELKPSTVASTRHRRREEIIYLRDKVGELETQLALLEQNKEEDSNTTLARNGVDHALAVMWHDISNRQQKLRQKSELEHVKLRALLETQVKVAQGLIKLMQKARRIEEDADFPTPKRTKVAHDISINAGDSSQLASVEEHYLNLDQSFSFSKFHDGSTKFIDVTVDDREEEIVVEFREAWSIPFKEADVLNAVWLYNVKASESKACKPDFAGQVTVNGDMLVTKFSASHDIGNLRGDFEGTNVTKKFTGGSGRPPAIVRSMIGSTKGIPTDALSGIHIREETCIRVLPVAPASELAAASSMSVVHTMQRHIMTFDDDISPAHRRQAGVLTDFLLEHLHQDVELKHVTVETLLLQARSNS